MSIREPNEEQKSALMHEGGVLLSAGAGSGKTFVLVEHIVHLVKSFNEKNPGLNDKQYLDCLRKYLSGIVMMTFTNKAAGELALRLKNRFKLEAVENRGDQRWELAIKALEYMTVGTIHGFCFKLLRQGFFPEMSGKIEIITEAESTQRIYDLYVKWFEMNKDRLKGENLVLYEILVSHHQEILSSIRGIFNNPDLRSLWRLSNFEEALSKSLDEHFTEFKESMDWSVALKTDLDLESYNKEAKTKWYNYLIAWRELKKRNREDCKSLLCESITFFEAHKGLRAPKADVYPEIVEYMNALKDFRDFVSKHAESLVGYEENRSSLLIPYQKLISDIVDFIENSYRLIPGVTFSDLEYFVLKGLEVEKICKRIKETYSYFIIDEFQDTSEVQYMIVERILSGSMSGLFCVGDMKQAIYGFRGGELGVFKSCMESIPMTKTMRNNYRSDRRVVDFNNHLFGDIFKKGMGFKGVDEHAVPVEFQEFPAGTSNGEGNLYKLNTNVIEGKSKFSSSNTSQLDYAESLEILEQIKKLHGDHPSDRVCILYRNLKPSSFLIGHMIENQMGFTAQVKIPGGEDPLLGMFNLLLMSAKSAKDATCADPVIKILRAYLAHLDIVTDRVDVDVVMQFRHDVLTVGIKTAFEKFVFNTGLSNSNYGNNMNFVSVISGLAADNIDTALALLESYLDDKYSLDFRCGKDSDKIVIMTVHASKGLEFDHVILGGMHSNGRYRAMDSFFGKLPGSFKWKKTSDQKSPFQTPAYLMESFREKKKDFAESKRLFYVAGTRAVKSISWVDLNGVKGCLSYGSNCWIDGIRSFENSVEKEKHEALMNLKENIEERELVWNIDENKLASLSNVPPLFQRDSIGLYSKPRELNITPELGNISELSVTRLASIAQWPRKFYLGNILKINSDDVDEWTEEVQGKVKEEEYLREINDGENFISSSVAKSSAERGTEIHEIMAHVANHNLVLPRILPAEKDRKSLEWGTQLLKSLGDVTFWAEKPIKFPMFNFTISGTPDLIILQNEDVVEIWDYKTGRRKEESEKSYWFQLKTYANACFQLGFAKPDQKIKLSLVYLDEQIRVDDLVDKNTLEDWLFVYWKRLKNLNIKDELHCPSCTFGKLCLPE